MMDIPVTATRVLSNQLITPVSGGGFLPSITRVVIMR